jgi:hypothetical protein
MGDARAAMHDHQRRAVADDLVVDQNAFGIDISFLHRIDIGGRRGRRSGFRLLGLRKRCDG